MSQIPPPEIPPFSPISYASAYVPTPDPRPKSLKVIAILSIVFGAFFTLGGLCAIPQQQMGMNPVGQAVRNDPVLRFTRVVSMLVSIALSLLELLAGIDAWRLKAWARSGLLWYAKLSLFTIFINLTANLLFLNQRMQMAISEAMKSNPALNTPIMQTAMKIRTLTTVGGSVLMMIWPTILLFYMTRPYMTAAFANKPAAD